MGSPRRTRILRTSAGVAVIVTAATLVITPAAHAGESGPTQTDGWFVTYQPATLTPRCSNGTLTGLTASLDWDASDMHGSYVGSAELQIGPIDPKDPEQVTSYTTVGSVPIPVVSGRTGTFEHTFTLPAGAMGERANFTFGGNGGGGYTTARILDCGGQIPAVPPTPTVTISPIACDGSYDLTIDATRSSTAWGGTLFTGFSSFRPLLDSIAPGKKTVIHVAHDAYYNPKFDYSPRYVVVQLRDSLTGISGSDWSLVSADVAAFPISRPASCSWPFPDVTPSNPHYDNIVWLKAQGITKPADGRYHPLADVSRGSMLAFLFRLTHHGKASPTCSAAPFPDVPTSDVFCGYIHWASGHGIAFGYSDGRFGPGRPVTRGAMAAFLHRIATGKPAPKCTSKPYADVPVNSTFCGVIAWAKANGITYGVGNDKYGTSLPVTRQSMASFLRRLDHHITA